MTTRRDFVAGAAAVALATPALARPSKRKNVLFIPIDDLNRFIKPLGGYAGIKTPNFNRLARRSLMFANAYADAPVCRSSRAATMFSVPAYKSGIYTHRSGDWTDSKLKDKSSLVRAFRNHEYETIGLGKIFHDGWRRKGERNEQNDHRAWSHFNFCDGSDACKADLDPGFENYDIKPLGRPNREMEDVERAKWLVKSVLSKNSKKPFFAAFGLRKPHLPWSVPKEWFDMYPLKDVHYPIGAIDPQHSEFSNNDDTRDLPPAAIKMLRQFHRDHEKIVASGQWKQVIRSYLAAISFADHVLGIVLDGLYDGPNADDTYLCVWSDHGWQLGEKLTWRKFTLWEAATQVPLFIGGPGIEGGRVSTMPTSLIDIYPTLTDLAYGSVNITAQGVSLADHCRSAKAPEPRDHVISSWALDVGEGRTDDKDKHFAVRDRTHRLIAYGNGDIELYHTAKDPNEIVNLAVKPTAENSAIIERMKKLVPKNPAPEIRGAASVPDEDD